jgi:signal transduction histidine kinase
MALLFTLLLGTSTAILLYFMYDFGRQDFIHETEAAIDAEINTMLYSVDAQKPDAMTAYVIQHNQSRANAFFQYEDSNGKVIAGNDWVMPRDVQPLTEGVLRFSIRTPDGDHTLAAKIHTLPDGSRIIVARDIHHLVTSYDRLKLLSLLIMVLLFAVVAVSFGISYFVVSRINLIGQTAEQIMDTGDLSRRITIDSQWDDLSNLAKVLNRLLEKIEALMFGMREVSNNIAHDLRTPLTSLRNDIEALRLQSVNPGATDALLHEADRILAIFNSLLRITNITQSKRHQLFNVLDLQVLLQDVMDLYEPVAEEKKIALKHDLATSVSINGDANLLFQLFTNLLDNAIKFAPSHGTVQIYLEKAQGIATIVIQDNGPGIPDQEKSDVFRHFYRSDSSRSTPGNGLGLSLVKAVVEHHGGRIALEDAAPGLRVRVVLNSYQ